MKQHFLKHRLMYCILLLIVVFSGTLPFIFAENISQKIQGFFQKTQEYANTLEIVEVVELKDLNKSHCEVILRDDIQNYSSQDGASRQKIASYFETCSKKYNISAQFQDISFCKRVISGAKKDFQSTFILLDGFSEVQNKCIEQYLTVSFTGGVLFNPKNDFKSEIKLKFGLPFYYESGDPSSAEFQEHKTKAKQRLLSMLEVSPKVEISPDDIVLYGKEAKLSLNLLPETSYTFSFKQYEAEIEGQTMNATPLTLKTPQFQYFGLQRIDAITLVPDSIVSEFELLSYNSDIGESRVKICRVPNESYAKIEVLESTAGMSESVKDFFVKGIDSVETYECFEKNISFRTEESGGLIKKQFFDFSDLIGNPARSGLYFVTFSDTSKRNLYGKTQEALFFGVIDAHITMKLSKNGEAYFFVNDFSGKPLAGQKIRAYTNEFQEKTTEYIEATDEYEVDYYSPLAKNIFSSGALLGETDSNGILQVSLEGKVQEYFNKTFESWEYSETGKHNSFFVTSSSDTNQSYVSSQWNGGITPWNFGYTLGSDWWYGDDTTTDQTISLDYGDYVEKYVAHVFAERRLYLPGETVHMKGILRNAGDLSLPVGKKFILQVSNSEGKNILDSNVEVSQYGAIEQTLEIPLNARVGNYNIYLKSGEDIIASSAINIEIFQNPKFENNVMLEVKGLSDEVVDITDTQREMTSWGYERESYSGNFNITATIDSQYYSGNPVSEGALEYKVYKQPYYSQEYWADCFYGCYYEAEKEFYTQGSGILDAAGKLQIELPISFESNYDDYKYIVEATVTDKTGDIISGTNSIIARLPAMYKKWNPENRVQFTVENRFYKAGEEVVVHGGLAFGKFSEIYENQDIFLIKKKEYYTEYVKDVRGYKRPVTRFEEKVKKVLLVNSENFDISKDGKLSLKYEIEETGEYIFEYGKIHSGILQLPNGQSGQENLKNIVGKFQESGEDEVFMPQQTFSNFSDYEVTNFLTETCDDTDSVCDFSNIDSTLWCQKTLDYSYSTEEQLANLCENKKETLTFSLKIKADDLIASYDKRYFTVISYGDDVANNPVISDNKITVLSEKMVYNIGDTAKVLVRLPFSKGKIPWTEEKDSVVSSELLDVTGNIFFKEIKVTDKHLPNTYISVMAIDTDMKCEYDTEKTCMPEYKVGYTEIVGDMTQKKSDVTITSNKKVYETRETVTLSFQTDKKQVSELTVMVVDDSLISLMGNIDANVLQKIYKKLPFQIQTSITNIAMLANYYFSRQGIVGGSGFGDNKGGDSAVSSRTIFKNTAYYNGNLITDANGKAIVEFTLPDNLTNFRVMAVSQSQNNFFGYGETMIEVRKDVLVEARVPLMMRPGDKITLGANIFNTTDKEINFQTKLVSNELGITNSEQKISVAAGKSSYVTWETELTKGCTISDTSDSCVGQFTMSILGNNSKQSDIIEGDFSIAQDPIIFQNILSSANIYPSKSADLSLKATENTDTEKSQFTLSLSNNPLAGIEKTYESLLRYPYGCVEQLLSATLPNAVLQRFKNMNLAGKIDQKDIDLNLKNGYAKIVKLQREDGGFKYWDNDFTSDIEITPHVLRNLLELKEAGFGVDENVLKNTVKYLTKNITSETPQHIRLEALWAVAKYNPGKSKEVLFLFGIQDISEFNTSTMSQHELLSYGYALYYLDAKGNAPQINEAIDTLLAGNKTMNNELYYSQLEDTALLASLMIDTGKSQAEVSSITLELYNKNWASYWISTKQKNAAFLTFVNYMETYGTKYVNALGIKIGEKNENISLDSSTGQYKIEKKLSEIISGETVSLNVMNTSGAASIFAQSSIEIYPKDVLQIQAYSQGIKTEREIYEVTDESQIKEECTWDGRNYTCIQGKGLTLHTSDIFDAGKTYKIVLKTSFSEDTQRNHLTLEDYLPAGFSVLNANFLTNSIASRQESSQDSWNWNQTQIRPELVMAHAKYSWGISSEYSYFIRADYAGEFLYPPFAAYLMYEPTVRSNTGFRKIIIK